MLEIQNLSINVTGDNGPVEILKNINLTLDDHALYVITGPNGGGKSSLAKAIMGIMPTTSGIIRLDGQDISALNMSQRAKAGIGYAFQQPPRFKGMTVSELLDIAAGGDYPEKKFSLLYDVGLCPQDYIDREVDTSLSGGELKRIEIATLLARNLKFAIYDEPEAGIDLWSFARLTDTFKSIHEKYSTTLILISHQERILSLADEIILVADGVIQEKGPREALWNMIMAEVAYSCQGSCVEGSDHLADCNRSQIA